MDAVLRWRGEGVQLVGFRMREAAAQGTREDLAAFGHVEQLSRELPRRPLVRLPPHARCDYRRPMALRASLQHAYVQITSVGNIRFHQQRCAQQLQHEASLTADFAPAEGLRC